MFPVTLTVAGFQQHEQSLKRKLGLDEWLPLLAAPFLANDNERYSTSE